MSIEYLKDIKHLIEDANSDGVLIKLDKLDGYSGDKIIGVLQRLAKYHDIENLGNYLEVGVYRGLSLISVAKALTSAKAFGVDNFSQFDPDGKNRMIVESIIDNEKLKNVRIINEDYENALENLQDFIHSSKIAVYFIDGPHDYRSQLVCLNLVKPHLAERAVIVIDDCNYEHVRLANRDFLVANPEFKLIFEAYTSKHPGNMSTDDHESCRYGWWNGINIIAKDPSNIVEATFPMTRRNRLLYENEHLIHTHQYAELAPQALLILELLRPLRLRELLRKLGQLIREIDSSNYEFGSRFRNMNTHSDYLPKRKFNPSLERLAKN